MARSDFISELFRRAIDVAPGAASALRRLELDLRHEWGDERVYVCRYPARMKAVRLGQALARGENLREAISAAGLAPDGGHARALLTRKNGA